MREVGLRLEAILVLYFIVRWITLYDHLPSSAMSAAPSTSSVMDPKFANRIQIGSLLLCCTTFNSFNYTTPNSTRTADWYLAKITTRFSFQCNPTIAK